MSWVYYADREPTEEDSLRGFVLVALKDESIHKDPWNFIDSDAVAWMNPSDLLPLPKRKIRRAPTQADLDKATEPIRCVVREHSTHIWNQRMLLGVAKFGPRRYVTWQGVGSSVCAWEECEIEVEE